ncbi:hypothetical protein GPECTOR_83g276 [Gonium pectorale]|uniref:Protein kinase domain-containing protein n=1 Tax=Gonium pectorale TaxID=33097 RepID=A0A150G1G3_GONPE|nr:hypothetical protein GPECTOR_83g276 [Gonium pectorale]|eukprot:KXZ43664.1 hypothetical protein GPECTOR_83g276 [Gonium pectorale]
MEQRWQAVTGELGRGAQGVVYRGTWRGLPVAIKNVLFQHHPRLGGGGGSGPDPRAARALAEAAISASLSHPNIVATYTYMLQPLRDADPMFSGPGCRGGGALLTIPSPAASSTYPCTVSSASGGAGLDGTEVWKLTFVQELCDANSLRHCLQCGTLAAAANHGVMAKNGASTPTAQPSPPLPLLPSAVVLALARDVACGMGHLHYRGVIHADLSTSNILLQSRPPASPSAPCDYVAKVDDFGLSGRLDPDTSATHLSGPAR